MARRGAQQQIRPKPFHREGRMVQARVNTWRVKWRGVPSALHFRRTSFRRPSSRGAATLGRTKVFRSSRGLPLPSFSLFVLEFNLLNPSGVQYRLSAMDLALLELPNRRIAQPQKYSKSGFALCRCYKRWGGSSTEKTELTQKQALK